MKDKTKQDKKQDRDLWENVTRDVTPLKDKNAVHQSKERAGKEKNSDKQNKTKTALDTAEKVLFDPKISAGSLKDNNPETPAGIDHRTQQRLKRGKMPIDGRLDLHGKTQNEAYDALMEFIPAAQAAGKRCILIITGKGLPRYGDPSLLECSEYVGVLKQKTPYWLNSSPLSRYILDIQPARPNHGGDGAIYVLLRRKRQ